MFGKIKRYQLDQELDEEMIEEHPRESDTDSSWCKIVSSNDWVKYQNGDYKREEEYW